MSTGSMEGGETATLRETAHAWRVLMADEPSGEDRRAFSAWLEESSEHRRAYDRATSVWDAMRGLKLEARRQRRRRSLSWAGGALAAGIAAFFVFAPQLQPPTAEPDPLRLRTAQGEVRVVTLDDDTVLTLGGASELRVVFTDAERRAVVLRGDVYLDVTTDTSRPFVVSAGATEIRVVGTAFSVRQDGTGTAVQVSEGRVQVLGTRTADSDPGSKALLSAGQSVRASLRGELGAARSVDGDDVAAWRSGRLIFDGAPLHEVVSTLDRYFAATVELGYTVRRDEAISATLKTDDLDGSLEMLSAIFELELDRDGSRVVLRDED
ncbi:MAG: FecR domain-containing protein [Pseudomonadota bacterium]